MFTFVIIHGIVYVCEATTRAVVKTSMILLWHHILWFVMIYIGVETKSVFVLKLDFLLDYWVCWEFGLYMVLVARRLQAPRLWQRALLVVAFVTYGGSRIVQAVWVLALFIYGGARMRHQLGVYCITLMFTTILMALQIYTLRIYVTMWKRSGKPDSRQPPAGEVQPAALGPKGQESLIPGTGEDFPQVVKVV